MQNTTAFDEFKQALVIWKTDSRKTNKQINNAKSLDYFFLQTIAA